MGLFCEVVGALQLDELDGAATKRERGRETQGVLLRELVRQPVQQVVPQGCCQAHGGHSELGAFPGGVPTQPSTYSQEADSASGLASWQQKDTGPPRQTAESHWDLLLREPPIAELEMLLQC